MYTYIHILVIYIHSICLVYIYISNISNIHIIYVLLYIYEERRQLSEAVRRRSYSYIILHTYIYSILQIYNILPHCTVTSMRDPWAYRHGIISHHSAMLYLRDIYIHMYHMVKNILVSTCCGLRTST